MKILSIIFFLAAFACMSEAKVTLPHVLSDNMVLQQNADARLWGKASPNTIVKISVSWSSDQTIVNADKDGNWKVTVRTPEASYTPLSITFDDGEPTTLHNILSGEVWVCGGQSNMDMPIKGFSCCPVEGYNEVVADAVNSHGIHYLKIPNTMNMEPQDDADCQWVAVSPSTVADASATGYFFARMVNRTLDIPVGIIIATMGGTRVESWLSEENLRRYTDEPLDSLEIAKKYSFPMHYPMVWGNGTFHPIINYTVRGIIYYQGCSNVGDPGNQYSNRLALLAKQWREQFALGEIPFYYVQIAPYNTSDINKDENARLQEQQFLAQNLISNSGLVCTNDAVYPYEVFQIHPAQKQKVGERLAYQALNKTYGIKDFWCESPSFESVTFQDGKAIVNLKNTYGGLNRFNGLVGFELAGDDKVFHPADASYFPAFYDDIIGVTVSSPEVPNPVAVRYCFRNFMLGNVTNLAGLPLFPFRSDNWE